VKVITWFAGNTVAANLLMLLIVVGGLIALASVEQEVFPRFSPHRIQIDAHYPGASPVEIEEQVCIPIEEAIHDLEGVERIDTEAGPDWRLEDRCHIVVQVRRGDDVGALMSAIRMRIGNIPHLPDDLERIEVEEALKEGDDGVIWVALYGPADVMTLKRLGDRVQAELARIPGVDKVVNYGEVPYEVSIQIPGEQLRRHRMTLAEVADAVRGASLNLPGGMVKAPDGEMRLRVKALALDREALAGRVLLSRADGSRLTLGDFAEIRDGLAERWFDWRHNGLPAQGWEVYARYDDVAVARRVKQYVAEMAQRLPEGLHLITWWDDSQAFSERMGTLMENGLMGFALVFLTLALFLGVRVAWWAGIGVLVAMLGALAGMALLGLSLNMLSLFGFVLAIGILVDDAIIVGESVHKEQAENRSVAGSGQAATTVDDLSASAFGRPLQQQPPSNGKGASRLFQQSVRDRAPDPTPVMLAVGHVAGPVTLAVVTTAVAFLPGLFLPGWAGAMMGPICAVMVLALCFSLVETLLILPAHLAAGAAAASGGRLDGVRRWLNQGLEQAAAHLYVPLLAGALRQPFITMALFLSGCLIAGALVQSGHVRLSLQAEVTKDTVAVSLNVPAGAPFTETRALAERVERAYLVLQDEINARQPEDVGDIISGVETLVFEHWAGFWIELAPEARQRLAVADLARKWRKRIGDVGRARLNFSYRQGDESHDIEYTLGAPDPAVLAAAVDALKQRLSAYPGVFDVEDTTTEGKPELYLALKPRARHLGLTSKDLARQTRRAFHGEEVYRMQRGREEVRVVVRLPLKERRSLAHLRDLPIRLPGGDMAPLDTLASIRFMPGPASLVRQDRQRIVRVRARVEPEKVDANALYKQLEQGYLIELERLFPDLRIEAGRARKDQEAVLLAFIRNAGLALVVIYALIAVSFSSYRVPWVFLFAVPVAWCGGIFAHWLGGLALSMESLVGMLAASGVVVNDGLVLLHTVRRLESGAEILEPPDLIRTACLIRFRPILLAFLTTFAGLLPLLFESSAQAQFLVPMAVALAAGLLFGMIATLVLIPAAVLILLQPAKTRNALR